MAPLLFYQLGRFYLLEKRYRFKIKKSKKIDQYTPENGQRLRSVCELHSSKNICLLVLLNNSFAAKTLRHEDKKGIEPRIRKESNFQLHKFSQIGFKEIKH